jgi:hypothetical protein
MRGPERFFLLAFVGHFALVVALYVLLTYQRMTAVRAGRAAMADFVKPSGDPSSAARVRRNLANQFEAPMFAYFAAAVLLWAGAVGPFDVAAAWIFLAGRIIHTCVQTMTDDVALRGQVYTISFLATLALMGHLAWLVLEG